MVKAAQLARAGYTYLGRLYSEMDCQAFVEQCLRDCGLSINLPGSNAWYRKMTWTGSPEECKAKYGLIPPGAFLFILSQDGKEPEKYKKDGIGNASHIGIYTGTGTGAIHSSASKGCVVESRFTGKSINGGWNRVGLWDQVQYSGVTPTKQTEKEVVSMEYQARVIGEGVLNLRVKPDKSSSRITQIPVGSVVTVIGESDGWCKINFGDRTGFVMAQYLQRATEAGELIQVDKARLMALYDELGDLLGLRG